MLKRYFIVMIIIGVIVGLIAVIYVNQQNESKRPDANAPISSSVEEKFELIEKGAIKILLLKKLERLELYNNNEERVLENVLNDHSLSAIINGGYFSPEKTYIGLLFDEKKITPISVGNPQATHIVVYKKLTNQLFFVDSNNFSSQEFLDENTKAFQTGPIIVDKNILQTTFIDKSLNGNGDFLRSFLGFTNSGKVFVGITTDGYDLRALGNDIMELPAFVNETVSIVNLDGGSSTSLSVKGNGNFSFRDFKVLPYLIGID